MTKSPYTIPAQGQVRRSLAGIYAALLACAVSLQATRSAAAISEGGGYGLESSVISSGGGETLNGGGYSSRGASGQQSIPAGIGLSGAGGYVNRVGFYNPPRFTFQKNLAAQLPAAAGVPGLTLPAGAVDKELFDVIINCDPVSNPLLVDATVLSAANAKIEAEKGVRSRAIPGRMAGISVFDEEGPWSGPFLAAGTLTLLYSDDDGDGVLDGSSPPLRTETLRTWMLDPSLAVWAKVNGASSDDQSRSVTVPFTGPGVYALLGAADESVSDVYAFPVPFRPYGPKAGAGGTGTEADGITFMNVPQSGSIGIYTLDGRLVRDIPIPAGLLIPKVKWDVRISGGERAASGVYIWRVKSGSNAKSGKLMVIW